MRYLLPFLLLIVHASHGQADSLVLRDSDSARSGSFIIPYSISVTPSKKDNLRESYNGAVQTIFVEEHRARVRLVSLMRFQSIFLFDSLFNGTAQVAIAKESGKEKYRYDLSPEDWSRYNSKYGNAIFQSTSDSAIIAGYICWKGIVKLESKEEIECWYTPQLKHAMFGKIMPAFSTVPGIVLQYSYRTKNGGITYTAREVITKPIDASAFQLPSKGYLVKKIIKPPE